MRSNPLTYILLGSLALGGCGSDDPQPTAGELAGAELTLRSETESEEIGVLEQGDVVGLTVINELTGQATTVNAQYVVDANGLLVGVTHLTFPDNGASISLFAYAPYRADWDNLTDASYRTVEVATDQQLYAQYHASDFIIGLPEGGNPVTRTDVKMIFSHAFAQVNLELTDPTEVVGLASASVGIGPVCTQAFVNPRTGDVTAIPTVTGTVTPYARLSSHQSTRSDRREVYSAILIPQTMGQGSPFLEVTTATRTYRFTLPEEVTWQSGMTYDYAVEITSTGITIVSSSISRWTTADTGEDIYIEE